jgi:hypothetical protein
VGIAVLVTDKDQAAEGALRECQGFANSLLHQMKLLLDCWTLLLLLIHNLSRNAHLQRQGHGIADRNSETFAL